MYELSQFIIITTIGNQNLCLIMFFYNYLEYHSAYSETNFRPGKQDIFNGPATLFECDQFQISDSSTGPVQITLYHEGIYVLD